MLLGNAVCDTWDMGFSATCSDVLGLKPTKCETPSASLISSGNSVHLLLQPSPDCEEPWAPKSTFSHSVGVQLTSLRHLRKLGSVWWECLAISRSDELAFVSVHISKMP